jgi:energy-coupling factor transport system substrate-specific component
MSKRLVVFIALCAALNLALGTIVYLVKLPLYLDMVGTILCAMALPDNRGMAFVASATAGEASVLLSGLINPYLPWFSATAIAIAAFTALVTNRWAGPLRARTVATASFWAILIPLGVATGLVAAIVSAPVVAYLFGGVTGSGSAALVAFFLKTGDQIMKAALLSGFTAEPLDKTIQLLLAVLLLRATPQSFLSRLLPTARADSRS